MMATPTVMAWLLLCGTPLGVAMTIASEAAMRVEAITERLAPALDTFDETIRRGRRLIIRSRHAAEDVVTDATRRIRRQPLRAAMIAVGAGALAGGLIGFGLGWLTCTRNSHDAT
jgi:hypothetical protein